MSINREKREVEICMSLSKDNEERRRKRTDIGREKEQREL